MSRMTFGIALVALFVSCDAGTDIDVIDTVRWEDLDHIDTDTINADTGDYGTGGTSDTPVITTQPTRVDNLEFSVCVEPGTNPDTVAPTIYTSPGSVTIIDPSVRGCCAGSLKAKVKEDVSIYTINYSDPDLRRCYCQCDWEISYTVSPVESGQIIIELPPAPGFSLPRLYSVLVPSEQ